MVTGGVFFLIGALLSFAQNPFYGDSHDLQDQQLADLIMWAPDGLPYLIAAAWCALRWLIAAANPGATTKPRAP
jgi:cytochrome c oxidase assembly factor CtaG